ncbi:MAG TPA: zf-HC2 domain-containing protein [Gemmatimonadales bacterium]|nr:zf-HC2 domain-containing protein [Gemmatimonadales bacterium]
MSHVDEGTLHAYLDGQLSGVEAERVRAHVGGCAACHARLDEERALIERANRLLERVAPSDTGRPMPALEALAPRSGRRLPYLPLAWAATIALAIGLGWYLRGPGPRPGEAVATASPIPSAAPVAAAPPAAPTNLAARTDQSRAVPESRGQLDATPTAQSAGEVDRAAIPPAETALAANRAAPVAPAPGNESRQSPAAVAAANPVGARDEVAAKAVVVNPGAQGQVMVSDEVAATWPDVPLDSARALLGGAFATIPGLPIGRVQASAGPQAMVLVTLTPDSRTTIRLYEQRAGADRGNMARLAAPARTTTQRLARYVGSLRVEITGTVNADSLSRLLERAQ